MNKIVSKLLIYGELPENSILSQLSDIFCGFREGIYTPAQLTSKIYTEIRRLLVLATKYGFDKNLWHNYLSFILITNENPFSLTCEKVGANNGSVN